MKQEKQLSELYQQIEVLREQLHEQKDITNKETLRLSARLDRLIYEVMK